MQAGAHDRQEVWWGGSASLGLPLPRGVAVLVGDHAEARDHREGVVTAQAEARDRREVWCGAQAEARDRQVVWCRW